MNQISKTKEPIEPTDLIVMEGINLPVPSEVAKKINEGFNTVYTKIEAEIKGHKPDVTTKTGRKTIASLAYKISRTKTGLDDTAAKLTEDQKQMITAVNAERREMRASLDKLRDQVRAPLDQWEKDEEERIKTVIGIFERFSALIITAMGETSERISVFISIVENIAVEEDLFQKRFEEGIAAKNTTLDNLQHELVKKQQYERDQAELEALRQENLRREEEERLRQEEAHRIEAERVAEAQRIEAERLEIIRIKEAEELAAKNAVEAAERAAAEKIANAERMAAEAQAAALREKEQAERDAIAAKARAEREKQEALQQERIKIENERLARERVKAEAQAAADKRAADLKHRKRVNQAALQAMIKSSECSEDTGNMIIHAIAEGMIPHVQISY